MLKSNLFINLKKTWPYFKKEKFKLFLYLIIIIFNTIITSTIPYLLAKIIFNLSKANMNKLFDLSLLLFALEFFNHVAIYYKTIIANKIIYRSLFNVQKEVIASLISFNQKDIDNSNSGLFINVLNNDSIKLAQIFNQYILTFSHLFVNIGILVTLYILNKYLFIYLILVMIILYLVDNSKLKLEYNRSSKIKSINDQRTAVVTEIIRATKDIKVLNANNNVLEMLKNKNENSNKNSYKLSLNKYTYNYIIGNLKMLFDFFFIILGVFLFSKGLLNIGAFIVIYSFKNKVDGLLKDINNLNNVSKNFELSATRVFEIIDNKKFTKEIFGKHKIANIKGNIKLENIGFAYDKKEILKGINIEIKENEKVAIVGRSGSGKTTILNLITKLYSNYEGEIFLDDYNIKDLDKDSLRNNISLISQNPYIFNMSIKDNLKLVKEEASDKEIEEVCKIAQIHDYIMSLEDKYDALVGENALILSGGEKQRLAIARALLRKSKIILLDEATSALDNKTQEEIIRAINNLKGNHTVIIVAHRLSTIVDSDKIYVLDDGKIIAKGDHKSLIKSCNLYKKLYEKEEIKINKG